MLKDLANLHPLYYLTIGLLFVSTFFLWKYHQARILSFNTDQISRLDDIAQVRPKYIAIKKIKLGIEVDGSTIVNGVWSIHPNTANYLLNSAGLGENGNIIVYGHNKNSVFGPIRWLKKDDLIEVTGTDDKKYQYKIVKTATVDPDNLEYVKPTTTNVLTLYTCTGFLDSKRFVIVAVLN